MYFSAHNIVRRQVGARPPIRYPIFYKNLEILILAGAGRPAEALRLTRTHFVPKTHLPSDVKRTIVNQTAEELVKSVMKTQDQDMMQELKTLLEFFEKTEQVEVMSKTLEEYLLAPIDSNVQEVKKANVNRAVDEIQKIQSEMANIVSKEVKIPAKIHNTMIGAGGKLIQSIMNECGGVRIFKI